MILTLRTDSPVAHIGLYAKDGRQLSNHTWQADRQLARDLLGVIETQLAKNAASFATLSGIVVFEGPGSFTGLRIGLTVANTLAYAQNIPIVGAQGDDWIALGLAALQKGKNARIVLPHYGGEPNITQPKK